MSETELSTISRFSSREPVPMSRALDCALSGAFNAIEGSELEERRLPNGARLGLISRQTELDQALVPATQDEIRFVLATLDGMPCRTEVDKAVVRLALERDVADLSEFPRWAIASAVRAYRKGDKGNAPWRPTTGEIVQACRYAVLRVHQERAKIAAVLSARIVAPSKPIDPDQRKRLADEIRAAAERMGA